ncbi:phosphate acetyltransferase [Pusillimonas sp. TS35]|uniref:phosphate acetyltransferase n=1 Tax=Paracandidimonas lactea TaxID=2895524 RepID=UPI00136FEABB|nr:phosphate acetyltransferase [Paracandidimonas lactea]MYN13796.1 phosphate acetyltransferase [Pusillimonas sp. TS35]
MQLLDRIYDKARRQPMRIVLCEADDPRVREAGRRAAADGLAQVIMVAPAPEGAASQDAASPAGMTYVDPATSPWLPELRDTLLALRAKRGMTAEQAAGAVLDPLVFAQLMVRQGYADGSVAGAVHTTADVVRNALQIIGKRADTRLVSSFFLMLREQPLHGDTQAMIFSDCGLVIDPDAEELAEIALAAAQSARTLLDAEPRLAMLSFSTNGSASHKEVEKVHHATQLVRARQPELAVDGEIQLDAAIVPAIAQRKVPQSNVHGQANVLIFPNLSAGNIGYKLTERLGGASAVGPLLQGLNKPANDLSRGCSAQDVYNVIAITAVQAQGTQR